MVAGLAVVLAVAASRASQECVGDCDGDGAVTIAELITGVRIALGLRPRDDCPGLAAPGGEVGVSRLVVAVASALGGCAPARTSTATATETALPTPTATAEPVSPEAACAALAGTRIGGAAIGAATLVGTTPTRAEHCRVLGSIAPRLNFEIRLPTRWNGRALFVGGSGLNGFIAVPELVLFIPNVGHDGYATIGTDSGHQGSFADGSWALGDREALEDFADRAIHRVLDSARAVIAARYGRAASRTYFIGMSEGGREGLIAAQRWPDDFDGIVALEPVYDLTALALAMNRVAQHVFATPGGRLSHEALAALSGAVLDVCDPLDGIADGIISHVGACHLDPAALRCREGESGACLTEAQIATVNAVHDPLVLGVPLAHDVGDYPGWPIGHELPPPGAPGGWPYWILGGSSDPLSSAGFSLSDQILRFLVVGDPALDTLRFMPAEHANALRAFSALVDATDPDLSAFAARGGKLILWHGLADYAVSARSTARYYERVVAVLGGQDAADRFVRFYTSPGVGHLNEGPGAGTTDFLGALTAWVERNEAPGDLVSTRAGSTLTRPLCRHPRYPHYRGSGDPDDAASFRCTAP